MDKLVASLAIACDRLWTVVSWVVCTVSREIPTGKEYQMIIVITSKIKVNKTNGVVAANALTVGAVQLYPTIRGVAISSRRSQAFAGQASQDSSDHIM